MAKKQTNTALVTPPDIDVQAADDDLVQLANDGSAITKFMAGLAAWFMTQRAWEKKAEARLMAAKAIPAPTDQASDEVVQKFVTATTAMEKEYEDHSTVKGLIWKLHKRAVAIHNRGANPFAEAKAVGINLHNKYAEAERQRVAAENAKRQREADDKARIERQAELDRLERERLAAEMDAPALSERETLFVDAFVRGSTPEMAASAAGYKNALVTSGKLLITPKIETAIEAKRAARAIEEQKKAIAAAPLDVAPIEEVRSNVGRAATDVSRNSAELLDEEALAQAVFDNKLGIPRDVLMVNPVKLNQYARDLGAVINRWPGVRLKTKTGMR